MQQLDTSVRLLDASAQVVRNAFQQSIQTKLLAIKQKRGFTNNDSGNSLISTSTKHVHPYQYQLDSNYMLTQYTVLFKHMETLWGSMDPSFSLCLCIPCKAFGKNPTVIPRLLSTRVIRQNAGILLDVDEGDDSSHEQKPSNNFDIQEHNSKMQSIYSKFTQNISDLRNAKKTKKIVDEQNLMKRRLLEAQQYITVGLTTATTTPTTLLSNNVTPSPNTTNPESKKRKLNVVMRSS